MEKKNLRSSASRSAAAAAARQQREADKKNKKTLQKCIIFNGVWRALSDWFITLGNSNPCYNEYIKAYS